MSVLYVVGTVPDSALSGFQRLAHTGAEIYVEDGSCTAQETYDGILGADGLVLFYEDRVQHGVHLGLALALGKMAYVVESGTHESTNPFLKMPGVVLCDNFETLVSDLILQELDRLEEEP